MCIKYVQAANGAEDDVLLVGDFNRNPTDAESYRPLMAIPSMTRLFEFPTEITYQRFQSLRQHLISRRMLSLSISVGAVSTDLMKRILEMTIKPQTLPLVTTVQSGLCLA